MAQPVVENAYGPHKTAMNQALASENGVAVKLESKKHAVNFRHQCHTMRARYRSREARKLGPEHADKASTPWDDLTFYMVVNTDGTAEIHIRKLILPEIVPL